MKMKILADFQIWFSVPLIKRLPYYEVISKEVPETKDNNSLIKKIHLLKQIKNEDRITISKSLL